MAGKPSHSTPHSDCAPRVAAGLSPLIHDRIRLAILTALATSPELSFNELKELTDTTDGNLLTHVRRLEEGGLVNVTKTGAGRGGRTTCRLAEAGRLALETYLKDMERLLLRVQHK